MMQKLATAVKTIKNDLATLQGATDKKLERLSH